MEAILNIHDISKDLEEFPQKLWVLAYGGSMDGWAIVVSFIMLDEIELLQLIDERHASNQKVIVLMGKVEFVVVGSK